MGLNINVAVGSKVAAVTPSDTADVQCAAFYVGGAGNVAIIGYDDTVGTAVTLTAIPAGTFVPIACRKIMSTNTTATAIVAIYV